MAIYLAGKTDPGRYPGPLDINDVAPREDPLRDSATERERDCERERVRKRERMFKNI